MTGFSALSIPSDNESQSKQHWKGRARIKGPAWTHMPSITICLLGVQIFWSVEMAYGSPYLISLGLSKSFMALVFVAGPLSGLLMQPLIGVLADNSRSRWGRRRPYMLVASAISVLAMLLLGFTRQFASIFTSLKTKSNDVLTVWLAILSIYFIDFAINAVQALNRALLVDTLPTSDQPSGNAWAARMLGIGSVMGFFIGSLSLPEIFSFIGKTQLQVLSVLASLVLIGFQVLTACCVEEKVLVEDDSPKKTFIMEIKEIVENIKTLPRTIRQICVIQFFAWIGWFPVIFYTTTYIGDIYKRQNPLQVPSSSPDYSDAITAHDSQATRLGSRALLISAVITLASNILLPFFVAGAIPRRRQHTNGAAHDHLSPGGALGSAGLASSVAPSWFSQFQVHLATMWAGSHLLFAACMMGTIFTSTVFGSTVLLSITGFSWAITQWAPFSLLAEAILTSPAISSSHAIRLEDARTPVSGPADDERQFLVGNDENDENEPENGVVFENRDSAESDREIRKTPEPDNVHSSPGHRAQQSSVGSIMRNSGAQLSQIDVPLFDNDYDEDFGSEGRSAGGLSAKAGIILGIHNIFVVVPQFLVTAMSSIIFALLEPDKSVLHGTHPGNAHPAIPIHHANGTATIGASVTEVEQLGEQAAAAEAPNSVGIIFRIGGVSAMIAFVLCWRLARELRHR